MAPHCRVHLVKAKTCGISPGTLLAERPSEKLNERKTMSRYETPNALRRDARTLAQDASDLIEATSNIADEKVTTARERLANALERSKNLYSRNSNQSRRKSESR
jgi:ElaB/YqjD/DUF883 family membrane-anchored ribosome-binding protein